MTPDDAHILPASVTVPDDVLWQQVEDRVVLLDLRSNEYHSLNDSGSRMWLLLSETGDVSSVLERLSATYDADQRVLGRDLAQFIAALEADGLLATAAR